MATLLTMPSQLIANNTNRDYLSVASMPISRMALPKKPPRASPKQLLHALHHWKNCVHIALWPYALKNVIHLNNTVPSQPDGTSHLQSFVNTEVGAKMYDKHTFGCSAFAIQNALQGGNTIPKWAPRASQGVNLGPSPSCARNVYLGLNSSTGLVSSQFHVSFDDFIETISLSPSDITMPSTWHQLSKLVYVFTSSQTDADITREGCAI